MPPFEWVRDPHAMKQLRAGHELQLLCGGVEYFDALVVAIEAAQDSVHLETYLFDFDVAHGLASIAVARALVRAAQRGVSVRCLMDGAGTGDVPSYWQTEFNAAGLAWRVYSPFGPTGWLQPSRWRRLHRKLCVIDPGPEGVAFCGGINLLDDYFDPNHGVLDKPRFDFAVRARGPLVAAVADAVKQLWEWSEAGAHLREAQLGPAMSALRSGNSRLFDTAYPAQSAAQLAAEQAIRRTHDPQHVAPAATPPVRAALLLRDNLRNRATIERAYRRAIGEARLEIVIANAYFLPGGKLRRALVRAAKRGVRVTLLLQGRYEYFMQWHAARPIYDTLLKAGVRIVEYEASFLHAKVAVIDADGQPWATVGSSNLDPLSLLMAREANVVVQDSAFALALRNKVFAAIQTEGRVVDPLAFANRPWWQRGLNWLAYALMRAGLWVMGKRY